MKKLVLFLTVLSLISVSYACDIISIGSGTGNVGDSITVPLNVDWMGDENTSLNIMIYYDANGVELTNIDTMSNTFTYNETSGNIGYVKLTTTNGRNAGLINLANLTFKITTNGSGLTVKGCKNYTWVEPKYYYNYSTNTSYNESITVSECYPVSISFGVIKTYPDLSISGKTCEISKLVLDNDDMSSHVVDLNIGKNINNTMSIFKDYVLLVNATYNTKSVKYIWESDEFNDSSFMELINSPDENYAIYINNSNGSMLINEADYIVHGNFYNDGYVQVFGKTYYVMSSSLDKITLGTESDEGIIGRNNPEAYIGEYKLRYTGGSYDSYIYYELYKNGVCVKSGLLYSGDKLQIGDAILVVDSISDSDAHYVLYRPVMNITIGEDFNGYSVMGLHGYYFDGSGIKFVKVLNQVPVEGMEITSPNPILKAIFDTSNTYHYEQTWIDTPFEPVNVVLKETSNLKDTYLLDNDNVLSKTDDNNDGNLSMILYPNDNSIKSIVIEPKKFGNYSVNVMIDSNNDLVEENENNNILSVNYKITTMEKIPIKKGWNLVSIPYYCANIEIPNNVSAIITYEASNWTQINNNDNIYPLYGYYIYSNEDTEINVSFIVPQPGAIAPPQRTFNEKGWYLVGVNPNEYTDGWNQMGPYHYDANFQRVRGAVSLNNFVAPLDNSWSILITDKGAYTNTHYYYNEEGSPNLYAFKGYWLFMKDTYNNILAGRSTH